MKKLFRSKLDEKCFRLELDYVDEKWFRSELDKKKSLMFEMDWVFDLDISRVG